MPRKFPIAAGAIFGLFAVGLCGLVTIARAQQNAQSQINQDLETIQLRPNFYMIGGAGSNIGVQVGPDGVILVDAGAEAASDRVIAAVKHITDQPIRYIIDTNADADHVSGNAKVAKAGRNIQFAGSEPLGGDLARDMTNGFAATVLASEGVLSRMSAPTGKTPAYPSTYWPQETFYQDRRYIYLNGEGVEMFRLPAAHSDADIAVFFRASDVIAAGDVLDMTRFPMIDGANGGSIQGEIDALNRIIKMTVTPIPFIYAGSVGTYVIPGHGRACEQLDVVEYRDMVVTIRDIIKDLIESGRTLEQVKAANPAGPWAPRFGAKTAPWTTDAFVEAIYKGLKGGK
jgi:glyoxylase-like metal-dependent hydrolase (beta-lactamase superfamily II)